MKLFQIKPIMHALVQVDYLGGTLDVPANHEFVAMTKLDCANGETKGLLVSYEVEPRISKNGYYVAVEGTGHSILGEVEYQDPRGSLRRVQGHNRSEAILSNAEELVYKISQVLESDIEDKIHTIFCPKHGLFVEFLEATNFMLVDHFQENNSNNVEPAEMEAEGVPRVRVVNASDKELPSALVDFLSVLAMIKKSGGVGRA